MCVIRHAVDRQQFVFIVTNNTRKVFLYFDPDRLFDQGFTVFDSKHVLDIQLGVSVGHDVFDLVNYKYILFMWILQASPCCFAPTGLSLFAFR